jgi:threonine synthase
VLEGLGWEVPDWIVVPGGNLGNSSAFGKAFLELKQLGLISRVPRLAVINAAGANTLYQLYEQRKLRWNQGRPQQQLARSYFQEMDQQKRRANTIASAIEINRPVNLDKCLRALDVCNGVVREVTDQDILDAKAQVGACGMGCEPASAASVAGAKLLRSEGVIGPDERVVCILTGHQLKDPTATVAYHGTDRGNSRAYWAFTACGRPPLPIARWPWPTIWERLSTLFRQQKPAPASGAKLFSLSFILHPFPYVDSHCDSRCRGPHGPAVDCAGFG